MDHISLNVHELTENWTLLEHERELVSGKRGPTRLGFAVLLKFHTRYGRFPRDRSEVPDRAVDFLARQVRVPAAELDSYDWTGRTIEYHRAQIRRHFGFRECTVADAEEVTAYLTEHVAREERRPERVRAELLARLRAQSIEPPTPGRCDRIVKAALRAAEESLTAWISSRLTAASVRRIVSLVDDGDAVRDDTADSRNESPPSTATATATATAIGLTETGLRDIGLRDIGLRDIGLRKIKEAPAPALALALAPGDLDRRAMLVEIDKLLAIRAVELPPDLFGGIAPAVVAGWRARAEAESPSRLRTHPLPLRVTLLAALLHQREREIADSLVELLISISGRGPGRKRAPEDAARG
ncbi:DUF4158 domain-containing protein [Streptomyces sp. NPDC093099]|uniref:DUF4158 domain-containing protein n=1 Tax=Streptomyces sp. NPDC093099 TaxID=3366028 RepID=UPI0037FD7341